MRCECLLHDSFMDNVRTYIDTVFFAKKYLLVVIIDIFLIRIKFYNYQAFIFLAKKYIYMKLKLHFCDNLLLRTFGSFVVVLFIAGSSLLSCSQTTKPAEKFSIIGMNDTTVYAGDTVRLYATMSSSANIFDYYWSWNGGAVYSDTTTAPVIERCWQAADTGLQTIAIKATNTTNHVSDSAMVHVTVIARPAVVLSGDSIAYSGDTTHYFAGGSSGIAWYLWSIDSSEKTTDTLYSKKFVKVWSLADTGRHMIYVRAQTKNGALSFSDSIQVFVYADVPMATLPADTVVAANDTVLITAQGLSHHASVVSYRWFVDNNPAYTVTTGNSYSCTWSLNQTGTHYVTVRAVDSRGTLSEPDTMLLHVTAMYPQLKVPHDTLISRSDTSSVTLSATGVGGATIVKYYWGVGSIWLTDSTTVPQKKLVYTGKDTLGILVGVKDSRGLMTVDSFHVFFNAPPEKLHMIKPASGDTVLYHLTDSTFYRKSITFSFSAFDRNAPRDTITYSLFAGTSTSTMQKIYEGHDTACTKTGFDTAVYYWRLVARDRFGDSTQVTGSFRCFLQHLICFAGHSVAAGFDGAAGCGGYRKKVLDTLRARFGGGVARVKSVGPFITGYMSNAVDDSCFAVSGFTSKALMQVMNSSYSALTADIWVFMLGSNEGYSQLGSLMYIVNRAHANNPNAYMYIYNALPLKESYGMDQIYNSWLADSVAARKKANWNIWNINVYNVFCVGDTANPLLFTMTETPILHPNSKGYDTLGTMVLDTIKATLH